MLKMILDPMGGILLTNDGNAILREIEVGHPAAKSMIELSRTQDEEVGDGTTSVIILGELGLSYLHLTSTDICLSWRDSGTFAAIAREEYPPSCDNIGLQEGARGSTKYY